MINRPEPPVEMFEVLKDSGVDTRPISLASEIRGFLQTIADQGTGIDMGGGMGMADLWVKIQGREYIVTIQPTKKQIANEEAAKA